MDRNFLPKKNFIGMHKMFALLIMMVIFIVGSPVLRAQHDCDSNVDVHDYWSFEWSDLIEDFDYVHHIVATDCSRIGATVTETEDGNVRIDVISVGQMEFDALQFSFFYDTGKYALSDADYSPVGYGNLYAYSSFYESGLLGAVTLSPALPSAMTLSETTWHRNAGRPVGFAPGYTFLEGMAGFEVVIADPLQIALYTNQESGKIEWLCSFYLKNKTGDALNFLDDIGFGVNDVPSYPFTLSWTCAAGGQGLDFTYYPIEGQYGNGIEVRPNFYYFRSAASVETAAAKACEGKTILNGTLIRPNEPILPETPGTKEGILDRHWFDNDVEATSLMEKDGKLDYDRILQYGFIYTSNPLAATTNLSIDMYSNELKAGGASEGNFLAKLSGSTFTTSDAITYTVVPVGNSNPSAATQPYSSGELSLPVGTTYYAWSFATYYFQTSQEYALLGERISFTTTDDDCTEKCVVMIDVVQVTLEPSCGAENGEIVIYANGGNGDYEYSIDYGDSWNGFTSGNPISIGAGTYFVYVRDAVDAECAMAMKGPIIVNTGDSNIKIIATGSTPACGASGTITYWASGGDEEYVFALTLNGENIPVGSTPGSITVPGPGLYVLTVTDGNGTGCVASTDVNVGAPNTLTVDVTGETNTSCGNATGKFTLNVIFGTPPYTYLINGKVVESDSDVFLVKSLSAGIHTWNVTDADGCSGSGSVNIENTDIKNFIATAKTTDETCNDPGTITLTMSETETYTYNYGAGTGTIIGVSGSFSVPQGIYDIVIEGSDNCTYTLYNIVVGRDQTSNLAIQSISKLKDAECNGADGEIELYVTGGSGNYAYSIDGGTPVEITAHPEIIPLSAGTYIISVMDVDNPFCGTAISVPVTMSNSNSNLSITANGNTDATCGGTDGVITYATSGGIEPYTYLLTLNGMDVTPDPMPATTISSLTTGLYILTVTDADGCTTSTTTQISSTTGLPVMASDVKMTSVCGASDGNFTLTINGGVAPYTYQIDGGVVLSTNETVILVSGLSSGTHTWKITDSQGCIKNGSEVIGSEDVNAFTMDNPTAVNAQCDGSGGSIILTVTDDGGSYAYYSNYGSGAKVFTDAKTTTIKLPEGIYSITVTRDGDDCSYDVFEIVVGRDHDDVAAPSVTSPQTFCTGAKVENLQTKDGVNIVWYDSPISPSPLLPSDPLTNGAVYYAAQDVGGCNGVRSAVKVNIDSNIFLSAPELPGLFELCGDETTMPTLADIPTYGNTNLVWFEEDGITPITLPLSNKILTDGDIYYVAQSAVGACALSEKTEIMITISTDAPQAPTVDEEQHFCEGALVANLAVPNNQIVWYDSETSTTPLSPEDKLEEKRYYAAQKAGDCESERVKVEVILDQYPTPAVLTTPCYKTGLTIGDLVVIGAGIRWYASETGDDGLPTTHPLNLNDIVWVAQTLGTCESDRTKVIITGECYDPYGTVFPFVHTDDDVYDNGFEVLARLYVKPPDNTFDKQGYIRQQTPLQTVAVTYYDCTKDAPIYGAPKNPGVIGNYDNSATNAIRWHFIGVSATTPTVFEKTNATDYCTTEPIGKYKFTDVAPGEYVIAISRKGFLIRYGVITVEGSHYLGHRELLGGDVNNDMKIDAKDQSALRSKESIYGTTLYDSTYDLRGLKSIDANDINILRTNFGAPNTIYQETEDWVNP